MIGRDVEQHGDVEDEAVGQLELIGAHLQHVDAVAIERLERQHRQADIAADLDLHAGGGKDMTEQRRGGRFAVGAGDAGEPRFAPVARQQLDIADDLDAGRAGARRDADAASGRSRECRATAPARQPDRDRPWRDRPPADRARSPRRAAPRCRPRQAPARRRACSASAAARPERARPITATRC